MLFCTLISYKFFFLILVILYIYSIFKNCNILISQKMKINENLFFSVTYWWTDISNCKINQKHFKIGQLMVINYYYDNVYVIHYVIVSREFILVYSLYIYRIYEYQLTYLNTYSLEAIISRTLNDAIINI